MGFKSNDQDMTIFVEYFVICAHIWHICVSWYVQQCYRTEIFQIIFVNIIFHFIGAKNDFFVKLVQKIWCKITPVLFSQKVVHI